MQKFCRCLVALALALVVGFPSAGLSGARAADGYRLYLPEISRTIPSRWIGPFAGSVVALAGDPNDPQILYAGTFGAGVFKSVDGGQSWFFASQGIANTKIDSLAVHPRDGNIVYAGTHGGGVYQTTDGGQSWHAVNQGIQNEAVVYTLTVNPGNPELVYAGTRGIVSMSGPPWNGVLYKSTNAGASWQPVLENIGGAQQEDWIYSVRVDPSNPNMVLAAAHEHGLFLSDSYGGAGEWQQVGDVDGSGRAVDFDPRGWKRLAYYGTWHRTGVYRSMDGGYGWEQSSDGLGEAKIYPNGIALAPVNPDWVYLASFADSMHGVMRSTDSGASWQRAGMDAYYVYSVYVPEGETSTVFAGTAGQNGIFRSRNGGSSWEKVINGLTQVNASGLVVGPAGTLYAATRDVGVMASTDGGISWVDWSAGLGDRQVIGLVQSPADPSRIFALTASAGLRRLDPQSGSWVASGALSAPNAQPPAEGAFPAQTPDRELINEMLGRNTQALQSGIAATVLDLAFAPTSPNFAYAATSAAGLYTSTDGGLNWNPLALAGRGLQAVVVHPQDPKIIYVVADAGARLLGSVDGGKTWPFDHAIPDGTIQSILITPDDPGSVYAAGSTGLWRIKNSAWALVAMPGQNVISLAADPLTRGQIYAGTDRGVFRYQVGGGFVPAAPDAAGYSIAKIVIPKDAPRIIYLATTTRGFLKTSNP